MIIEIGIESTDSAGIIRYLEGLVKHLDDPLPFDEFLVLHC
jgi:hypothetical protein